MIRFIPLASNSARLASISIEPSLKGFSPLYCPMNMLFFIGLRIQKIVSTRLMYRNITAVKAIFLPVEKWALGIDEKRVVTSSRLEIDLKFERVAALHAELETFVLFGD